MRFKRRSSPERCHPERTREGSGRDVHSQILRGVPLRMTAVVVGMLLVGCVTPRAGQPLAKELAGSDPDAQVNFWHALADQPVTSNDQAFHGLLLYVDGKDDSPDYAARIANLKSRGMLPLGFYQPPGAGVHRGVVAVAIM